MKEINEQALFERLEHVEVYRPFGLYLYTPLCGTCKAGMRMMHVVEAMLPDIELLQINMNFSPRLVARYQVRSVPGLFLFDPKRRGEPVQVYEMRSVEHLFNIIKDVIR